MTKQDNKAKIFFTQTLNSLISGVLQILIPLLMLERNIDVVTIGFIFAITPFIFQTLRVLFGAISDIIGRKIFFVFNSVMNIIVLLIYFSSATAAGFLYGKISEGVKNASIWSVNRAALMDQAKEKRKTLTKLIGATHIASAVGSIGAGFLIVWLTYTNTLYLCLLIAMLLVPTTFSLANGKKLKLEKIKLGEILKKLDIRKKNKKFKRFAGLSLMNGLTMGLVTGYVLPLFLIENGFTTEIIGLLIGLNVLLVGITSIFVRKTNIKKLIIGAGVTYSICLFALGLSGASTVALIIILVGASKGLTHGVFESIISGVTDVKSYGGDVGMLTVGLHVGRSIGIAFSGLLISYFGFFELFALGAIIYSFYSVLVYREFNR